jgi:importin subunit beta-1
LPYLLNALNSHEEYQLCGVGVGLVGDISRALGEQSLQYAGGFMDVLLADLQSTVLHRSVKPTILSTFGDIALAINGEFEPFLATTMGVLQQAGAMRADPVSFDTPDRLDAFSG